MTEPLTIDAGATSLGAPDQPRAFIIVHHEGTSRLVELPHEIDVTFGRSRGATIMVDHDKVSRVHARLRRTDTVIEIEDLESRNGTRVNGEKIEGITRLRAGDEISIGPATAVVGYSSSLRRGTTVGDAATGEARLVTEVDRAVRYHRPVTIALVRIADDTLVDAIARALRPMDLMAEDVGDDYLVILPELGRTDGVAMVHRILDVERGAAALPTVATVVCPDDGTTVEVLVDRLRTLLRGGRPRPTVTTSDTGPIVGDVAMRRVYSLVERIAESAMTVLILGETGVGKELVTEAVHQRSTRRDKPLIKLNCAALPETLLESELFGYERGAFTGADKRKVGFFEAADGATLFLDEIGDMPLTLQAKLLRVLERKVITRVGGTAEIAADARVIAATHRDLEADVRSGRFRQDLLFRIAGFTLVVPPLRDRPSEIIPLAEHFAQTGAEEQGRAAPKLSDDVKAALSAYAWPGNVRELKNAIERALVLCGDEISHADLPDKLRDAGHRVHPVALTSDVRGQLAEVERAAIVAALDADSNNQTRAARRLGLSRRALIYKMEKYGLKAPPK